MRRSRVAALLLVFVALALAGCATTQSPVKSPDAATAVAARAAIDAAELIRVEALRWAGGAHARGEITDERLACIAAAGAALEAAEAIANAELAAYLNSGSMETALSLDAALAALVADKAALIAAKGGRP